MSGGLVSSGLSSAAPRYGFGLAAGGVVVLVVVPAAGGVVVLVAGVAGAGAGAAGSGSVGSGRRRAALPEMNSFSFASEPSWRCL